MLRILLGVLLGGCAALTTTGTLAVAEADEPAPQVGSMCPAELADTMTLLPDGTTYVVCGQSDSGYLWTCLLYTSPSPRDRTRSRMPSSA